MSAAISGLASACGMGILFVAVGGLACGWIGWPYPTSLQLWNAGCGMAFGIFTATRRRL